MIDLQIAVTSLALLPNRQFTVPDVVTNSPHDAGARQTSGKPAEHHRRAETLAPGWYPDPGGGGGTLYWDGRGWHTAPLPKSGSTDRCSAGASRGASLKRGLIAYVAAVVVLIDRAIVVIAKGIPDPLIRPRRRRRLHGANISDFPDQLVGLQRRRHRDNPRANAFAPNSATRPVPIYTDDAVLARHGRWHLRRGRSCGVKQRDSPTNRRQPSVPERSQGRNDDKRGMLHIGGNSNQRWHKQARSGISSSTERT